MNNLLDGAQLKIFWAEDHLKLVKQEIQAYINMGPHELRAQKDINGNWSSGPVICFQPSDRLSLMVGDCLTNARAALDHVMFQIVLKWFDPPFDITNLDHRSVTGFPLYGDTLPKTQTAEANRFKKLKHFMPNVPADVFRTIKSVQPYNARYQSLFWLNELVNTDKHRLLLLAKSDIPAAQMFLKYPNKVVIMGVTSAVNHSDLYRISGLNTQTSGPEIPSDVEVKYDPTIHVTFEDIPVPLSAIKHIPVESILQQILETVVDVLPEFDKLF